jgi:hypothetical protein
MYKKIFWVLFFLLFGFGLQSSTVFADTKILINGLEQTPRDYRYVLKTDGHHYSSVVLDCQSFVNGIEFYRGNDSAPAESFFLYHNECEDIFFFVQDSEDMGKQSCLLLNQWERTYKLSPDVKDCI